jgi:hypothetical protein
MMVKSSVRATIELPDGRGTQRCHGPVWDGLCPHAARDGSTPCAGGRILAMRGTWADGAWISAPQHPHGRCPLAGLVSTGPAPWD